MTPVLYERSVYEGHLDLKPGQQWFSEPIPMADGDILRLEADSTQRCYAGFFSRETFERLKGMAPAGRFPFQFGTDRMRHRSAYLADGQGDYFLVFRLGVFNIGTTIQMRAARIGPNLG